MFPAALAQYVPGSAGFRYLFIFYHRAPWFRVYSRVPGRQILSRAHPPEGHNRAVHHAGTCLRSQNSLSFRVLIVWYHSRLGWKIFPFLRRAALSIEQHLLQYNSVRARLVASRRTFLPQTRAVLVACGMQNDHGYFSFLSFLRTGVHPMPPTPSWLLVYCLAMASEHETSRRTLSPAPAKIHTLDELACFSPCDGKRT